MNSSPISHKTRQQARPWVENLARCGYAAKGFVYILIGILALQAALGAGGQATDTQGALLKISQQSFGRVLLFLMGIGLAGYALWRLVMAVWDSEDKGRDAKAMIQRIGYGLSGLAYGALAGTAFQLVLGAQVRGGNSTRYDWTARALAQPSGRWLIGFGGTNHGWRRV